MAEVKTNPYGANQYQLDPRQKLCWDLYVDPKSETFGSGRASALKAGYTEGTANQITTEDWFIEKTRTLNMLEKAEKNLNDIMELPAITEDNKVDSGVLRVKADVSKFVAERVGKDRYSSRQEHTGKDGGPIETIASDEIRELANQIESLRRADQPSNGATPDSLGTEVQDQE